MRHLDGKVRNPDVEEGGKEVQDDVNINPTDKSDSKYQARVGLSVVVRGVLLISVQDVVEVR